MYISIFKKYAKGKQFFLFKKIFASNKQMTLKSLNFVDYVLK
jgi:hypothetical protein